MVPVTALREAIEMECDITADMLISLLRAHAESMDEAEDMIRAAIDGIKRNLVKIVEPAPAATVQ